MEKRIIKITKEQYDKIQNKNKRKVVISESQYELVKKLIIKNNGKII